MLVFIVADNSLVSLGFRHKTQQRFFDFKKIIILAFYVL